MTLIHNLTIVVIIVISDGIITRTVMADDGDDGDGRGDQRRQHVDHCDIADQEHHGSNVRAYHSDYENYELCMICL